MKFGSWIKKGLLTAFMLMFAVMPTNAQEAFTIDDYDVTINVEENGALHIQETLMLDFSQYRHGFYRNIPTSYSMSWVIDGKSVDKDYYFPVTDISCGGTKCSLDYDSQGVVIQLGDKNVEVIGSQLYTISYTVQTKDLDLKDTQMLYWNLADNFDTTIKHLSFTINMPKSFNADEISAYSGFYGSVNNNISYEVKGNTITGETLSALDNYEAATIMVRLPADYFRFPEPKDFTFLLMVFSACLMVISLFLFWKFGKDDEVIVTVEFKAPKDLNSAGVGYVIDGMVESKDILSLIIEWANKGYLKIKEENEALTLIKLMDIPKEESTDYERKFFNAIFKKKDEMSEEDLADGKVGEALYSAKNHVRSYFERAKSRRVFSQSSAVMQGFFVVIAGLPSLLFTLLSAYSYYEVLPLSIPFAIPSIFFMFSLVIWIFIMKKRYVMKRSTLILSCIGTIVLNTIVASISVGILIFFKATLLTILCYIALTIALIIMLAFMEKRTAKGNEWLGQILGLKEFILYAEKDRIEMLAKDNPSAFYDILPYAYVLGISDTWSNKFENIIIEQPGWYETDRQFSTFSSIYWWHSFHHCFHAMSTSASYVPAPKGGSGGGSFGGGGFSGGGGGSW